jgi:putative PEP-CTERM system integral membrane protein
MNKLKRFLNLSNSTIFWTWNLIFILTVYLGIMPYIGIPLVLATFNGDIALDFCITFFILITIPVLFTFIGLQYLKGQHQELIRLFYGVEAPLFAWCLARLFLVREITLASGLVLGTLLGCVFIFAVDIFKHHQGNVQIHPWVEITVLLFYAIPVAVSIVIWIGQLIVAFFSFQWVEYFIDNIFRNSYWISGLILLFLSFILFGFTCTLFVGMPFALISLYVSLGLNTLKEFAQQYGKTITIGLATAVITIWMSLLFTFNQQPQVKAFELLAKTPQNREELLASTQIIRKGLVNANLSAYRYLSTVEDNDHIYAIYNKLGLNKEVSTFLQQTYNKLLAPFLYQGSKEDIQKSASLYAEILDTPLQKAERNSVRHAIKSTSIIDEAKAGLLNIDEKKVWLEKQEVSVKPQGDWADIEIHEVYNNQTPDEEEIFYYFSLPESAAITGLWLGDTDDLNKRFPFQVSPRGAAQEVYNAQVNRVRPVDPALLEQVGVGQYRLRAFPVPPRISSGDIRNLEGQRKMHLWLTYKVMKQEGGWALPKLAERRNIYWTKWTQRIRNGKRQWWFPDVWLEDAWQDKQSSERKPYQVALSNNYLVEAKPLASQDYSLPSQQKYAVILDTSYSVTAHRQEIEDTLAWWRRNLVNNDVDLYITDVEANKAKLLDDISAFNANQQLFYGSLQTQDMLIQFDRLKGNREYNAVLLVTDEGSYELADDEQKIPEMKAPLWMVHLGGNFPRAYDDNTLQAIQNSQGGVAPNVETVIRRLATEEASDIAVVDGYSWQVVKSESANVNTNQGIEPITARQLVYYLSRGGNQKLSLPELDNIHQVAKNYQIVTPYSSMIVLVNDQQREQLRLAEERDDRFNREVEKGFEDLNTPFNPLADNTQEEVSGVPEPDIFVLFALVVLALGVVFIQQKLETR